MTKPRTRSKRAVVPTQPLLVPPPRASSKRLRHLLFLVVLLGVGFWAGGTGGRWMASLQNLWPWRDTSLAISANIVPPTYTDLPDVVLATPEEGTVARGTVDVPEGSVLTVKMPETGEAPVLKINGHVKSLVPDGNDFYVTTETVTGGGAITLSRGWKTLDSWRVRLVRDLEPNVKFLETPYTVNGMLTKVSFEVSDDYGVESVVARVGPALVGPPSLEIRPIQVPLILNGARHSRETDVQDLTFLPWAGNQVDIQLEARDSAGNTSRSKKVTILLPRRTFSHPLARALVEEREKLLRQDDEATRDEAANIMAGIARTMIGDAGGDPVVFMALRTGAVRLVLDENREALPAISRLMWQAAARIEDTMRDKGETPLKQAGRDKDKG